MLRTCIKCGKKHKMAYVEHSNNTKHLVLLHEKTHVYIPFENNLDIKIVLTNKQLKNATAPREAGVAGQISLLTKKPDAI